MNLSTVKSITIPAGNVTALSIGGVKVWGGGSNGDEPAELLSWEGVAYHINKGTYKDVYAIGDMVPLDLGSEGLINMQVAAFDTDTLADGSGKAAISWVAKELLATKHRMNPALTGTTEGTGAIGGWEKCEMRTYLVDTIKPLIPSSVLGQIVTVTKTHDAYNTDKEMYVQTTNDEVWLPGYSEITTGSGLYASLFVDNNSRIKDGGAYWWTRDAAGYSAGYYRSVTNTGGAGSGLSKSTYGVCLGFCTGKTPT